MAQLVRRYCVSEERATILNGLLQLRTGLTGLGLTNGFQWVDGSFAENVEALRNRPPADVDVVTFVKFGNADRQRELLASQGDYFIPSRTKERFHVDAYYRNLDDPLTRVSARDVTYWYSMWAHRRGDRLWKGFLEIDSVARG